MPVCAKNKTAATSREIDSCDTRARVIHVTDFWGRRKIPVAEAMGAILAAKNAKERCNEFSFGSAKCALVSNLRYLAHEAGLERNRLQTKTPQLAILRAKIVAILQLRREHEDLHCGHVLSVGVWPRVGPHCGFI
jgi:hypothetical protein